MKRAATSQQIDGKRKQFVTKEEEKLVLFFSSNVIYIFPSRFGSKRIKIFENIVLKYGGSLFDPNGYDDSSIVTHVILEEFVTIENLPSLIDVKKFSNACFLKCTWLSRCSKSKEFLSPSENEIVYKLYNDGLLDSGSSSVNNISVISVNKKQCAQECVFPSTTLENIVEKDAFSKNSRFVDTFVCAHSSSSDSLTDLNIHITKQLEKLVSAYQNKNDTWRAVGYQKAIAAIKRYPKEINTWEEAMSIRGVGKRMADKIKEILDSGQLRKVKLVYENEETKVLELFTGVWGAGPSVAQKWYIQGFRTLEDLRTKANLTTHQKIGLQYYNEFNERMCRSEVALIEKEVLKHCLEINPDLSVTVCGSYRRGKTTCGDVDILITHKDGYSHKNVFSILLQSLKNSKFITNDLVKQEHNGNQQKYLGVCKLSGEYTKHRRLDIIVVPFSEYASSLIYFTGSAHFNRSMRLLASKSGMSLSEHGLRAGIVRDTSGSATGGYALESPTEESIFNYLGLKYRSPSERDY